MEVNITSRRTQIDEFFKERIDKKLNKLASFFKEKAIANIVVTEEGTRKIVELTVRSGSLVLRAQNQAADFIESFDLVFGAIIRQLHKNKTKLEKRLKLNSCDQYASEWLAQEDSVEPENGEFNVVKNKKFLVETMDVQEAILQMNLVGHEFYVFVNIEMDKINVVYRRHDGAYGLIEPEISD